MVSLGKNSTGLITYLFENFGKLEQQKNKNKNWSNDNWTFSKFDENTKAKKHSVFPKGIRVDYLAGKRKSQRRERTWNEFNSNVFATENQIKHKYLDKAYSLT